MRQVDGNGVMTNPPETNREHAPERVTRHASRVTGAVFVAPHPDDVALSCGGTVAIAARNESPLIATLFAGQSRDTVSDFARFQHQRWGVADDDVTERRWAEDRCAAAALGPAVRLAWHDWLDAIYRDSAYGSDDALFGRPVARDLGIVDTLADALGEYDADAYLVPLAVGNHVDHQLALRAGRRLAARGADVWAYADVPYVMLGGMAELTRRLATGVVREAYVTYLDDDAFERKWTAIGCYTSQLPVLFRDLADPREALDRYAREVGGGRQAEVCWRVLPSRPGIRA
jgi:LmbE family N-acetylglucosaminyl deacetylase